MHPRADDDMLIEWDTQFLPQNELVSPNGVVAYWTNSDGPPRDIQIRADRDNLGIAETIRYARSATEKLTKIWKRKAGRRFLASRMRLD